MPDEFWAPPESEPATEEACSEDWALSTDVTGASVEGDEKKPKMVQIDPSSPRW